MKGDLIMSKTQKLIDAFFNGEQLTAKQISARFGIANPSATVSDLRMDFGLAVYANSRKNSKGQRVTRYRLGTPTRRVVAAGYQALAQGLV